MTGEDLDRYRRIAEAKTARRAELLELAGDNWRATHTGPYQITDRTVGQPVGDETWCPACSGEGDLIVGREYDGQYATCTVCNGTGRYEVTP